MIKDVLWQLCVMYKKTSCKKRSFYTFFKVFIIIISVVKRCYHVFAFKRMMEMLGIIKTEAARDFGYWGGAVYQHMTCIFKTHIISDIPSTSDLFSGSAHESEKLRLENVSVT